MNEAAQRRRATQRAKVRRQRIAATLAAAIVIVLLIILLPINKASHADKPSEAAIHTPSPLAAALPAAAATPAPTVEADKPSATPAPAPAAYEPDAAEVEALARMLYGEARGIASDMEKAACVWCVLNRVDDPRFPDTVLEVLEAPYQFAGYKADYPVLPELADLAADVLTRYHAERDGNSEAGRVLPAEYVFFTGDGKHNHFTAEWKSESAHQWTLTNPYED